MPVTLQYPSKCVLCKEPLAPGTEANWIADESGSGFSHTHVTCPDPTRPEQRKLRERLPHQEINHDALFEIRECSECGQLWTFAKAGRRASRPTPSCPSRKTKRVRDERGRVGYEEAACGGAWVRGEPVKVAWAA
jgi:hypothetical protein